MRLKLSAFSALMRLADSQHKSELRQAGWHNRGYLPHFDGRAVPQFISMHLFDSVPMSVLNRWKRELNTTDSLRDRILLQNRIEKYLDLGYGEAFMKSPHIASIIQNIILGSDGKHYRLSAWVIMPNHIHMLATRFEHSSISEIMQSLKSITAHKANKVLGRHGEFWMKDYFDRYIRNPEHFRKAVRYIEVNPGESQTVCSGGFQ